ncbi:MAG: APC family permease [Endomicrobiales bacterium]
MFEKIKNIVIGKAHDPHDSSVFHNLSLIAFFAWVGLGADGLSSSCYGPQEAFLALGSHIYLSIFVALGSALTIMIISTSYSQTIELFPSGGGGYLVASKLLSPELGMISGCALLIDYVLTITVSIASGADAIFSFLPGHLYHFKIWFSTALILLMIVLNLRGVKESVMPLVPIFMTFVVTHIFIIVYACIANIGHMHGLFQATRLDVTHTHSEMGLIGMLLIILRAYSMGAGTFTGIEAVSNGIPILRDPKVKTAKKTMRYMAFSLAITVVGLMVAYLIYHVHLVPGKTLNAVLFETIAQGWGKPGYAFVLVSLLSEAVLLLVAAQAGFLDGPRVLANMALDRWFPSRFAMLSDRFVNKNGILIMGLTALAMLLITQGSVQLLVLLYSINVFITFSLSQAGMVRHWWGERGKGKAWKKKITVNGIGMLLTTFILISMIIIKFNDGGWATLLMTGALVVIAVIIKRHYYKTALLLRRLNNLVVAVGTVTESPVPSFDRSSRTAVIFVSGFNGLGLHTLFGIIRLFKGIFNNFVFIQIGVIDAGNFKGTEQINNLEQQCKTDVRRYARYMHSQGYYSEGMHVIGTDVVDEIKKIIPRLTEQYPDAMFFGGQLVFPKESHLSRWLHNYTVFVMQKMFYSKGMPFVLLPIRVDAQ